jgi:hypothetical protein
MSSQSIYLEPGQRREVTFPHRFEVPTDPGRATFSVASVSIPADPLAADDTRSLVVPVVAALPVVFVDQYGEDEDLVKNQIGETFHLRRLLAPVTTRGEHGRQLIQVRHLKVDQLDRDVLHDARLVVMAGVQTPAVAVTLLREYVEQGGQLFIAAGGQFDPVAWQEFAWLDGGGILPAPLRPQPIGVRPTDATTTLEPFFLDPASMASDYFQLEGVSRVDLNDLYTAPYFFKAVGLELREDVLSTMIEKEAARIAAARAPRSDDEKKTAPAPEATSWLTWVPPRIDRDWQLTPQEIALRTRPHTLAVFSNREPFLVQRHIGRGDVIFATSSVQSDWNTLPKTNAVLIYDRIFRSMLENGFPRRNLTPVEAGQVVLPVDPKERLNRFSLSRPGLAEEPLAVDALGGDVYGVTLRNLSTRGIYRVVAKRPETTADQTTVAKLWEIPLAVNGYERESELKTLNADGLEERIGDVPVRWVPRDGAIRLEGSRIVGQNSWKWIMSLVLGCLLVELVVLVWPTFSRNPSTSNSDAMLAGRSTVPPSLHTSPAVGGELERAR